MTGVDLVAGLTEETASPGAAFGPTFGCLLARQMVQTRAGDRFWYENDVPPSSFSRQQLAALRRINLASMLCDGAPAVEFVQTMVFVQPDPYL